MTDIDPEKLEEAIKACSERTGVSDQIFDYAPHAWFPRAHLKVLEETARAHLATLPRYKEVECVYWAVLDHNGGSHGIYRDEGDAHGMARYGTGRFVVRLTGTAKVRA